MLEQVIINVNTETFMTKLKALHPKFFRKKMDSSQLHIKNTNEIKTLSKFIGQERASQALLFGICVKGNGYIYAKRFGLGKRQLFILFAAHSAKSPVPPDWCYLHNLDWKTSAVFFNTSW